jgi:hypothetical protein
MCFHAKFFILAQRKKNPALMKRLYTFISAFCLLSVVLAAESPYRMTETQSVLPFKQARKLVLVKAQIDQRHGYFILDTGINDLSLNSQHFGDEENLKKFERVIDIGGARHRVDGYMVGIFRWGGIRRDSFAVPLIDMKGLEKILDCSLLGLIGMEVFRDLELCIHYDEGLITLNLLDETGRVGHKVYDSSPDYTLPFTLAGHLPVISARIGDQTLRMGWDSGASINLLNKKLRRYLPTNARRLLRIGYGGTLSEQTAPFYAVDAIYIDEQFAVNAWRMACPSMSHFKKLKLEIDGLIGADLLRLGQVAINYRRKHIRVWINKDNLFNQRFEEMSEPARVLQRSARTAGGQ